MISLSHDNNERSLLLKRYKTGCGVGDWWLITHRIQICNFVYLFYFFFVKMSGENLFDLRYTITYAQWAYYLVSESNTMILKIILWVLGSYLIISLFRYAIRTYSLLSLLLFVTIIRYYYYHYRRRQRRNT